MIGIIRKKPIGKLYAACAFALSLFLLCSALGTLAEEEKDERQESVREAMLSSVGVCPEKIPELQLATYGDYADAWEIFEELAGRLDSLPETAAAAVFGNAVSTYVFRGPVHCLGWKEAAALYFAYGERITAIVAESAVIDVRKENGTVSVRVEYPAFDEIAGLGTRDEYLHARFALAYFNTVYDEQGRFTTEEAPLPGKEYLRQLIHPLQGPYAIKDGWYDARSKATRLHTGTDIKAPARTKIHSVTDGIVLFVGTMPIPGNFVIIRDRYGYEYHYYHMIERSTFVTEGQSVHRGDVIGLVGNTGNSVANHLHLAVITPEDRYINPYDLFLAAGIGPIRINGKLVRNPKPAE